jgi:hypothetical protein
MIAKQDNYTTKFNFCIDAYDNYLTQILVYPFKEI